jgi:hypothetical protein
MIASADTDCYLLSFANRNARAIWDLSRNTNPALLLLFAAKDRRAAVDATTVTSLRLN